jgi:hypothetical protein
MSDRARIVLANTNVASATTTSAATALPGPADIQEYRVTATQNAYINFGLAAVDADNADLLVTSGSPLLIKVASGATHFAVIRDTADGRVTVAALG